jgi:transcriptional regulator with XRE-family HTH domain
LLTSAFFRTEKVYVRSSIGAFVKERRRRLKLNQPDVAGRDGVGLRFIQELECGKPAAIFDAAYPHIYDGDALLLRVGGTLAILNSHENTHEAQSYTVSFGGSGGLDVLSGRIEPHSYLLGRLGEKGRAPGGST